MAASSGYQPVHQDEGPDANLNINDNTNDSDDHVVPAFLPPRRLPDRRSRRTILGLAVCVVVLLASNLYLSLPYVFSTHRPGSGSGSCPSSSRRVPQPFQTSPELWPGPTATGPAAFLAQSRTFDPTSTFVPNEPLQTSIPVEGMQQGNQSIFRMMGYLSPYFPSPGFGVDEYPLPPGAEIVQVQMLSRHGARYPTTGANVVSFGERFANASAKLNPKGSLSFLKSWKYQLGAEILVGKGRQELFDSGKA